MMQKKEQDVYFALEGKHNQDNIFVTKKNFLGMIKKKFCATSVLETWLSDNKPTQF